MLDDVIRQIDEVLPLVHQRCEDAPSKPATGRLSRKSLKVFQDMRDNPLLNDEGSDICLCTKRERASGDCGCPDHQHKKRR